MMKEVASRDFIRNARAIRARWLAVAIISWVMAVSMTRAAEPERGPLLKPPADTVFVEAESMQTTGPGWQVRDYTVDDGYYSFPSGLKLLRGTPGATDTATAGVTVPHDGTFRVWVRCLDYQPGPYTVTVTQNSKEAGQAEFNEKTVRAPEADDKTYLQRAFVWWSFDVDLVKGPATLQLTGMKAPATSSGPWVDCIAMTADKSFHPHAWCFAQPLYLRLVMSPTHNKAGGAAYFTDRIDFEGYFGGRGHVTKQGYDQIMEAFDDNSKKFLYPGDVSAWVNMGPSLDPRGMNRMRFDMMSKWPDATPVPALLPDSDFSIELTHSPDEKPFYRSHREGKGSGMVLLIDPRHPEATLSSIDWSAKRLQQAREAPVPSHGKAPVLFPSFTGLSDYDASDPEKAIQNDLLTLRALGFTGSTAGYHNAAWMKEHGMIYTHFQSFCLAFVKEPKGLSEPVPDEMRDSFTSAFKDWYSDVPKVLFVRLMDEIFSMSIDQMKGSLETLKKFQDDLRAKGFQPADLLGHPPDPGKDPWASIQFTDDKHTSPKLYYYTELFRQQILTDFLKTATDVIHTIKPEARTAANGSCELTGALFNCLSRGVDLFGLYRSNALTYGFSEDANGQMPSAQTAGLIMDFLRSACKYHHQPYATYTMAEFPAWDDEAKAFDELGHGASFVHFYDYGPYHSDASDPLAPAALTKIFPAWKEFNFAVGSVENELYGAQVVPSRVAMLYSQTTDVWVTTIDNGTGSGMERVNLYLLLKHLGYAIDILTEDDVLEGRADGYAAIFTPESHFKEGVVDKLLDWVKKGGFLYAGAGAGQWDQFNQPTKGFAATGLKLGPFSYDWKSGWWPQTMSVADKISLEGKTLEAAGGKQAVAPDSAGKVMATFADGTPCATLVPYGKGQLLHVGFFPGTSYIRLANLKEQARRTKIEKAKQEYDTLFASWYPEEYRHLMQNLLKPMDLKPPVQIDNYLVEGNLLQGKTGQVLALANWSGKKQTIHVSVDLPYRPDQPRAAINNLREVKRQGNTVSFALDLGPGNFVVLPPAP